MANIYEAMNVRQKLAKARLYFLNQKVQKSGKNMHLEFKYFELEDIVPPATRIFARVGLTTEIDFTDEGAVMKVYNVDNIEEAPMQFRVPYREVKPIVSNAGKEVTNPMQALGSSITYLRRYLWMAVLDITEPDDIDANLSSACTFTPSVSLTLIISPTLKVSTSDLIILFTFIVFSSTCTAYRIFLDTRFQTSCGFPHL